MDHSDATDDRVRLDKWLWAARFFRTRSLAREAIEGGKVHYNGHRSKPGKVVETGARLRIRQGWSEVDILVLALNDQRRGASEARTLYQETPDSITRREDEHWIRKTLQAANMPPARRPTKKERRDIQRLHDQPDQD